MAVFILRNVARNGGETETQRLERENLELTEMFEEVALIRQHGAYCVFWTVLRLARRKCTAATRYYLSNSAPK